jgi:hypothetical protein
MIIIIGCTLIVAWLFLAALALMNFPPIYPIAALTVTAIVIAIGSQNPSTFFLIWGVGVTTYAIGYFWGLALR